jgi:phosphoglycolate/pyridoxal phosphate phosphatase family enzyme
MPARLIVILLAAAMPLTVSTFARAAIMSRSRRLFATSLDDSITEVMRQGANEQMDRLLEHHSAVEEGGPILWPNQKVASKYVEDHIDAILLDCDGVLYRGLDITPEAPECLSQLMAKGKQLFFVTNNAGQNRLQLRDKLVQILNCPDLKEEQMICSSYSCAQYLKEQLLLDRNRRRVHVIGTQGLCDELTKTGFIVTGGPSEDVRSGMSRDELAAYDFSEHPVDAVVVGLDNEFNYRKLCIANVLLQRNPAALFVATNEDAFDLVGSDARHLPGNGALVKALEYASQRKAVNMGKPSSVLANLIQRQHNLDPSRTLMVGDRLDTDIRFGVEGGMVSVLVLTGCTTANDLIALGKGTREEPMPDVILPYMGLLA